MEDLENKMIYLRNSKPKRALSTKRDAEEKEEPNPKKKRVDPKQFPHALKVPEMLVGEDVESCEQHNSRRKKRKKDSESRNNIKLDGRLYLSLLEEKDSGETNCPCQHQAIPLDPCSAVLRTGAMQNRIFIGNSNSVSQMNY